MRSNNNSQFILNFKFQFSIFKFQISFQILNFFLWNLFNTTVQVRICNDMKHPVSEQRWIRRSKNQDCKEIWRSLDCHSKRPKLLQRNCYPLFQKVQSSICWHWLDFLQNSKRPLHPHGTPSDRDHLLNSGILA